MGQQGHAEKRGRPITGAEAKSKELKIRIEPVLYNELVDVCEKAGVPVSHGVRTGILLFIKVMKQRFS